MICFGVTYASIKRPAFFTEFLFNILKKTDHFKTIDISAAVFATFKVNFLTLICFISRNLTVIQIYSTSFNFISDGIVWSAKVFGDSIN